MPNIAEGQKFRILVVDDEPGIVNAVRRELSVPPLNRRFEVEAFTDPQAALARADTQAFAVVLSDFRMPGMNGLEFLTELHRRQPDCVRIVLSGQTDFDSLIQLINESHIFRFIPKPWSSYFLKSTLHQAAVFGRANEDNRRLAKALREQGIDLPSGALAEIDHVLIVDDDLSSANALARSLGVHNALDDVFREVRQEMPGHLPALDPQRIRVQVTDSPLHALKMADDVSFSCAIADYRMPVMDGAQFLTQLVEKQPDCACIMVSAAANMEDVVIALDLAHIHAFLPKPWVDYELRAAVAQALMRRRLLIENRILAQMCRARHLAVTD